MVIVCSGRYPLLPPPSIPPSLNPRSISLKSPTPPHPKVPLYCCYMARSDKKIWKNIIGHYSAHKYWDITALTNIMGHYSAHKYYRTLQRSQILGHYSAHKYHTKKKRLLFGLLADVGGGSAWQDQ